MSPAEMRGQGGMVLIEGLVAVLIFSIGLLGVIGLQANSVSAVSSAKERLDASLAANEQIGRMWGAPGALANVTNQSVPALPGGLLNVTVTAIPNGGDPNACTSSQIDVTVSWRRPDASADSKYMESVVICNG